MKQEARGALSAKHEVLAHDCSGALPVPAGEAMGRKAGTTYTYTKDQQAFVEFSIASEKCEQAKATGSQVLPELKAIFEEKKAAFLEHFPRPWEVHDEKQNPEPAPCGVSATWGASNWWQRQP